MTTIWSAGTASTPSHRSMKPGVDHGTIDGKRTLCGAEVCFDNRPAEFSPGSVYSCKRCLKAYERYA